MNSAGEHEVHVLPVNDWRPHEATKNCWCNPTPDEQNPRVIVHHSMDRREEYENGRKVS